MSLSASFFQKDLLNAFNSDGATTYNIQNNGEAEQNALQSHTIQLSTEQATQLGLKFYDSESDDISGAISSSVDQVSNSPFSSNNLKGDVINVNEDLNLHRIFKNSNPNSQSFVIKPVTNNTSVLNRNAQFRKTMDEISELLSFNNDEEGTVYLQNNTFNKNQTSQLQYNPPINTQVIQASSTDNNVPQQVKYVLPKTVNTSKPYRLVGQPMNRSNQINYCNQTITLPNSQKISLQNLLNQKSVDTQSVIKTDIRRPVSVVPIKKQNRVKSILFKPTIVPINNTSQSNPVLQTHSQQLNSLALNNNNFQTVLSQSGTKIVPVNNTNLNERRTTVIRKENIHRPIQPLPCKQTNPIVDQLPYKIEYRLDLLDNNTLGSTNNGQNLTYTINIAGEKNKENPAQHQNDSKAFNVLSMEPVNNDLLNKAVSLTSKVENSIVPLSTKRKTISTSEQEQNTVQEALQRYPVNSNKPLGSTDNPIKLVQKGQTFHSLQSLNEGQLQQIAGALKHRPPHQQSGDREPHKVVLYDSATHTRIIYRIVYPDELDLKPGPDTEEGKDKESNGKEKRKRKMKLNPLPEPVPYENKQPLPRTRTGRVIRPPNRIINDYKRLRIDDDDKEEWIDTIDEQLPSRPSLEQNVDKPSELSPQEMSTDINTSEMCIQDRATDKPTTKLRNLNSKFRCPTCNKVYLGYGRMSKHLAMYPDHAEIDKLGIDPPAKNKIKKNYCFKPKLSNDAKLSSDENKEENDTSISDKSNEEGSCTKSLFECLMQKIENTPSSEKWNVFCNQLTGFMQDVQTFVSSQINDDSNHTANETNQITINDYISRITNLQPGQYTLKESFLSKTVQDNDKDPPVSLSTLCTSSPMKLILENSFSSMKQLSVDNIDIDMLCSTPNDFGKSILSNSRSELQRQMDILINEDACQNLNSLPETHDSVRDNNSLENISAIRDGLNLSNDDGMVYQNVDDLVHESLKNLTADEIAAVPPLEHSPDDLVNSQSSLQDLSLDLFQFHHN